MSRPPAHVAGRETRQGVAIETALARTHDFRTAQDLHAQLRTEGVRVGLTTVYRHLQRLIDAGEIDSVRTLTGELAYRRCSDTAHHHHLVCRHCGRAVDVDGPSVEDWLARVAEQAGFSDVVHTIEIAGTCGDCRIAQG